MTRIALILSIVLAGFSLAYAELWRLTVIFNNDRHGSIAPGEATFLNPETPPPLGKFASETAVIKDLRKEAEERGEGLIYIDQGDFYQGQPVGSLSKGEAIVSAYNYIMPDAVTVGNHEFDDGYENFIKLVSLSKFTWLGANLIDITTNRRVDGVEPFVLRKFRLPTGDSLIVGIIGITTRDTKKMSFPENTERITIADEIKTANAYAETLRTIYKADFIILTAHIGLPFDAVATYMKLLDDDTEPGTEYSSIDLVRVAREARGIDAIFGGHIHFGYREPWEDPETHTLVFQNYGHGTGFGGVRFMFDPKTKIFLGYEPLAKKNALVTLFADEFFPDKETEALVDSLRNESEKGLSQPIAFANAVIPRGDAMTSKVGHIVCDAMIDATGADVSTSNMGGVRAELPAGTITRGDVFAVMPFDNKIVVVPLSGKDLIDVIERMAGKYTGALIGGARVEFDPKAGKIAKLTIDGKQIDMDREYLLATTDYVFYSYNIPQFEAVERSKVKFTGIVLRDALERFIEKISPISPETDDRWKNMEVK